MSGAGSVTCWITQLKAGERQAARRAADEDNVALSEGSKVEELATQLGRLPRMVKRWLQMIGIF
jgi:hypothetical protein